MNEDHGADLFGLGPERPQPLVAELDAVHVRRNDDAAQAEVAHAAFELRRRQRDLVERQRAEPDQPVRMLRHRFGDAIIAETIHGEGVVRLHPIGALLHDAGADHLDVDAGRVHLLEPQRHFGHALVQRLGDAARARDRARILRLIVGALHHVGHEDMGVHVDDGRLGSRALDRAALACGRAGLLALAGAGRLAARCLRRLAAFTMNETSSSAVRGCGRCGRDGYSSRGQPASQTCGLQG